MVAGSACGVEAISRRLGTAGSCAARVVCPPSVPCLPGRAFLYTRTERKTGRGPALPEERGIAWSPHSAQRQGWGVALRATTATNSGQAVRRPLVSGVS